MNQTLKYLIAGRIKDASALIKSRRYPAALYIAGYAIEVALKYKICRSLQFRQGFPETKQELITCHTSINQGNIQPLLIQLGDIRNHDLNKLLFYSGEELKIKNNFFSEWVIVAQWSPENRYKKIRVLQKTAELYFKAARKIIKEIN
jgi:HEPN domain-containing protein